MKENFVIAYNTKKKIKEGKREEEAVRAANAEKEAKESLRLAQNARKEAEKKALEAVKESERIDEEMKLRLSQLKK